MSCLELLRTGTKLAFLNCPISIASYEEEENWHWTRTAMGQGSFASRRSRGILLNHQWSIRSLKKRFPSVIHHHITSLLQLFIGPRVLFFQFCDVAQVVIIHNYLAKCDNIQNMKLKNLKHPFCRQLWQFMLLFGCF